MSHAMSFVTCQLMYHVNRVITITVWFVRQLPPLSRSQLTRPTSSLRVVCRFVG